MATHDKQKKGVMYIYKLDTGNLKPAAESNLPPPSPSTTTKKPISRTWGILRRSKTYREKVEHNNSINITNGGIDQNHCGPATESRKSVSVIEEARKSASAIEEARKLVSVMEPRRSSAGNRVEMSVGAAAASVQVKILATDMPAFMQVHAFRCARLTYDSLEKFSPKHMAYNMKKEFDNIYGLAWHCIVGSSFGSFVTHATGCFLYFSIEKLYILIFKTKLQKTLK